MVSGPTQNTSELTTKPWMKRSRPSLPPPAPNRRTAARWSTPPKPSSRSSIRSNEPMMPPMSTAPRTISIGAADPTGVAQRVVGHRGGGGAGDQQRDQSQPVGDDPAGALGQAGARRAPPATVPTSTATTFTAVPIPGITRISFIFERLRRKSLTVQSRPRPTGTRSFHATSGTAHPRCRPRGRRRAAPALGRGRAQRSQRRSRAQDDAEQALANLAADLRRAAAGRRVTTAASSRR